MNFAVRDWNLFLHFECSKRKEFWSTANAVYILRHTHNTIYFTP